MKTVIFTTKEQDTFSELSGDFNPMHVDPIIARRLMFGSQVVHGVHLVCVALNALSAMLKGRVIIKKIKCIFKKNVGLESPIGIDVKLTSESSSTIQVVSNNIIVTLIKLEWVCDEKTYRALHPIELPICQNPSEPCSELPFKGVEYLSGKTPLYLNKGLLKNAFPKLYNKFSHFQISQLLATTRVVGMKCPGLHSIFAALELQFNKINNSSPHLYYNVSSVGQRYRRVVLNVKSAGLTGTLKTFFRMPPKNQASLKEVVEAIKQNEFMSQKALIIGGSRGLGEITAKILAIGGAEIAITWNSGKDDAKKIVDELILAGHKAYTLQLDVTDINKFSDKLKEINFTPTHLYYFATPFITAGEKGSFSKKMYGNFWRVYGKGFYRLLNSRIMAKLKAVYYPSTIYITEPVEHLKEYILAKLNAEKLCDYWNSKPKTPQVLCTRLPKMATDQTNHFSESGAKNPLPIILESLRHFNAKEGSFKSQS